MDLQKRRQKGLNDGTRTVTLTNLFHIGGSRGSVVVGAALGVRLTSEGRGTNNAGIGEGGGPKWSGACREEGGPSTELRRGSEARREREKVLGVSNRVRATTRHEQGVAKGTSE